MEVFFATLMQYLAEIAAFVVVTLIGIFGTWVLNKLKDRQGLENITIATEQVITATQSTVLELQQTLVNGWKRAQGGKLTPEQVEELQESVLEITAAKLSEPALKLLEGAKIDVKTMIASVAEGYVLEIKENGV